MNTDKGFSKELYNVIRGPLSEQFDPLASAFGPKDQPVKRHTQTD